MIYFRVKNSSDGVSVNKKRFLIAKELYTPIEIGSLKVLPSFVKNHFDKIEISSKQTYYSFGARFINSPVLNLFK